MVDKARGHTVTVKRQGFLDAIVWNPWIDKAKATHDFGDEEYKVGQDRHKDAPGGLTDVSARPATSDVSL